MSATAIPVKNRNYWIRPGINVVRNDGTGPTMEVDRIERSRQTIKAGSVIETRSIIDGVWCSWVDENGQCQKQKFHTRDLKKAE